MLFLRCSAKVAYKYNVLHTLQCMLPLPCLDVLHFILYYLSITVTNCLCSNRSKTDCRQLEYLEVMSINTNI